MLSLRKIAYAAGILFVLITFIFVLVIASYFYLPTYLETKIIPDLTKTAGISEFDIDIRRVGFFGAELAEFRIGSQDHPALEIQSVQIDYSPLQLYREKLVARTVLSGIKIFAEFHEGQFRLRNMDLAAIMSSYPSAEKSDSHVAGSPPLISLGRLDVRNAVCVVEMEQQQYRIPFEIDLIPRDAVFSALDVAARLYLRGHEFKGTAEIDLKRESSVIQFKVADLDFGRYSDLIRLVPELEVSGKISIEGRANLQLSPIQLQSIEAKCNLINGSLVYDKLLLKNTRSAKDEQVPFTLNVASSNGRQWDIMGSSLSVLAPVPLLLNEFHATVIPAENAVKSSGEIKAALVPSTNFKKHASALKILEPFAFWCNFAAETRSDGKWQVNFNHSPENKKSQKPGKLQYQDFHFRSHAPALNITAEGDRHHGNAVFAVSVPEVQILSGSTTARIPKATLKGTARYRQGLQEYRGADFTLAIPNTRVAMDANLLKVNRATISGNVKQSEKGDLLLEGSLRLADGSLHLPGQEIKTTGMRVEFPLQWPPPSAGKPGKFAVDSIQSHEWVLGSVRGKLNQTTSGFTFKGMHASKLFPQINVKFDGNTVLIPSDDFAVDLEFRAAGRESEIGIDLGKLAPAAAGMTVTGKFEAGGGIRYSASGLKGKVRTNLTDAKFKMEEQKIAINGIQMNMLIPNLAEIRSAPRQIISFTNATIGALGMGEGRIEFQLESPRSLFIEKSNFKWCGGNVDVPAIRIVPGVDDYSLTFYCDRLNLAQVLEQFGAAAAEGSGAVSGKIPLRYKNGKLSFDDGFLFSTPGEGGKIVLKGTEMLTAGIPAGTPQFNQMELAREALKDYDYSWAKLNLTTEGEDFLLRLQFDGKPANVLPFVYKKEIGGFVKVEAGGQGSRFQGIRLDVNFRMPLNKLMQYKDIVNMIQ